MGVHDQIAELESAANLTIPQKGRKQKIILYSEGLKSKLAQVDYALSQLNSLAELTDTSTTTTASDELGISDRIAFYCDSFWAFLYSSLDVLAQLINQSLKLDIDEKGVSFKRIEDELSKHHNGSKLQKTVNALRKSNFFKNLDGYRNCSVHRRQIYIEEVIRTVKRTAGYHATATGSVQSVQRIICDNPLVVKPAITQNRQIPEYLINTKTNIVKHISAILKVLQPIK